jgi:hypothetical protein
MDFQPPSGSERQARMWADIFAARVALRGRLVVEIGLHLAPQELSSYPQRSLVTKHSIRLRLYLILCAVDLSCILASFALGAWVRYGALARWHSPSAPCSSFPTS